MPEQAAVKALPDKYDVSTLVSAYWKQGMHFGGKNTAFTYHISIPQIYPFSQDAVSCQQEIYALFKTQLYSNLTALQAQHKGQVELLEVPANAFSDRSLLRSYTYSAGCYQNVLSIILRFDITETNHSNYYVYYLDLTTGKQLTTEEAQGKFSVEQVAIKNAVESYYKELYAESDENADWYQENLKKTVGDDNIVACRLFFTEDGKLMLVANIYTVGSVEKVEKLISLPE